MDSERIRGLVVRAAGGFYDVALEGDPSRLVRCRMRGRLKQKKRRTDLCVAGDWAQVSPPSHAERDSYTLESIEARSSVFSRQHPGKGGQYQEDVLVANLKTLLIVFAHDNPPIQERLIDRFILVAEQNDLKACLVANKSDLKADASEAVFETYAKLGYPVLPVSATEGTGIAAVRDQIEGHIVAIVGSSGVGKSSLLNAIDDSLALRVAETSTFHGKGRHTTRVATLHHVAGGWVADTPGIRELGGFALDPAALDSYFIEFRPHLGDCAFQNCRHFQEPRCAVKGAVHDTITEARYESYLRLLAEVLEEQDRSW